MPLDDSRPIRIRFEHTRFPHFGNHSGYPQFTRFLDSRRYVASLHGASDDGSECGRWLYPFKPVLQRLIARGGIGEDHFAVEGLENEAAGFRRFEHGHAHALRADVEGN